MQQIISTFRRRLRHSRLQSAGPMRGGSEGSAAPGPGSMAGARGRGPKISKLYQTEETFGPMQSVYGGCFVNRDT